MKISSTFLIGLIFLVVACGPSFSDREDSSDLEALTGRLSSLLSPPEPKPKAVIDHMAEKFIALGRESVSRRSFFVARGSFQAKLYGEILAQNGVPRDQLHVMVKELVSGKDCGGASCARVFNLKRGDVGDFLDDSYEKVKREAQLVASRYSKQRQILLASLQRRSPAATFERSFLGGSAINTKILPPSGGVTIDLNASDFAVAFDKSCKIGICQATLEKPFMVQLDTPIGFNSKIHITYKEAKDAKGGVINRDVQVGGTIVPVNIGDILKISVDVGAELESIGSKLTRPKIEGVFCKGTMNCDLPLISLEVKMDKTGMEFNIIPRLSSSLGEWTKIEETVPKFSRSIQFDELPESVRHIIEYYKNKPAIHNNKRTDIDWFDFVE